MRKNSNVGGQAVMEGVMMRSPDTMAMAVRNSAGQIALDVTPLKAGAEKPWYRKAPFLRGVFNFIEMLIWGVQSLNRSAQMAGFDEGEPSRLEKWLTDKTGKSAADIAVGIGMVLGLGLAVALFFVLPQVLGSLLTPLIGSTLLLNLAEGGIRLGIFFVYLLLVGRMPDIQRFFAYHGAEHKTINAYENGEVLTPDAVMRYTTRHPRCGTSFLLIVMVISVLIFALTGWSTSWYARVLTRLALLPVVAGVSYEVLLLLARRENPLTEALRKPGMALQRMTTREPDAAMCQVAITAFLACLDDDERRRCTPVEEEIADDDTAGAALGAAAEHGA
ncbi:MAG: DUF1385 domain-containing protein [Eubacteriales bacterium]|nr:DUF1385 domain-containing protein [Eubacteriales bacterium]